MRRVAPHRIAIIVLIGLTLAAFAQVLTFDFVKWDDDILIYENPQLKGLDVETVRWAFTERHVVRYQPLAWLVWAAIFDLQNGAKPFGYHFANLAVHLANVGLVFLLLWRLLKLTRPPEKEAGPERYAILCATMGAGLWAVHPLRVEAVAWISAYLHVQATFLLLVATLAYIQARTGSNGRAWYAVSVVSYALSLISFPTGLGFAIVPIVLDLIVLRPLKNGEPRLFSVRRWLDKIPFVLLAGLILAITLYRRVNVDARWVPVAGAEEFGMWPRLMQAFYIWAYYFWKTLLPLNLSPIYDTLMSIKPTEPRFLASAAGVVGSVLVLLANRKRWPYLLGLLICYLALMVPMLGLTERPHFSSDRYSYMTGICWSVLIAGALWKLKELRIQRLTMAALAGIILLSGVMSFLQAGIWRNSLTLLPYALSTVSEASCRATVCRLLGIAAQRAGQFDTAAAAYAEYIRTYRRDVTIRSRFADTLFALGRVDEAKQEYAELIHLQPNDAGTRSNFGVELAMRGDLTNALIQFEHALRLNPNFADAYRNAAVTLQNLGRTNEAALHFQKYQQLTAKPANASTNAVTAP